MQNIERKNKAEGYKMKGVGQNMSKRTIKRVRKYGRARMVLCAETGNICFGRAVYEELQTGDLAVIIEAPNGAVLVDLDTFLGDHRFFEKVEVRE